MKLTEIKSKLNSLDHISFKLPDGSIVASHFHITEIGHIQKRFIDCGGTIRDETKINFQLWSAEDHDHRLTASKLLSIISLAEKNLDLNDSEIEIEYQNNTIGKYHLGFDGTAFLLKPTQTDCLAREDCRLPSNKEEVPKAVSSQCLPDSKCC